VGKGEQRRAHRGGRWARRESLLLNPFAARRLCPPYAPSRCATARVV